MRLARFVLAFFLLFSFCGVFAQQSGVARNITFAQFKTQMAPEKDRVLQPFLAQIKDLPAEQQSSFLSRANTAWNTAVEELWAAASSSSSQEEVNRKSEPINEKLMRSLNAAVFSLQLPALKDAYGEEAAREVQELLGRLEAGSVTTAQFQTQWQELMDKNFLQQIRQAYGRQAAQEIQALLNRRHRGEISAAQYQRESQVVLQRYGAQQLSQAKANLHSLLEQEKSQVKNEYFYDLPAAIAPKYQRQLNQIYSEKEQAYAQLYDTGASQTVFTQKAQTIESECTNKLNALLKQLYKELGPAECMRRKLHPKEGVR